MMVSYYVRRYDGKVTRLAKIEDHINPYGYVDGKWESMNSLIKILYEITDFDEITEEEAKQIMAELDAADDD